MSDKTTEEAAEMSPKEALRIATVNQGMLVSNGNKYYPEHVSLSAIAVFAKSYAACLSTTIAQLREENERHQWVSIEDRLPGNENDILICRQDGFEDWQSIGNYIDGKYYNVWDLECECFPTHWKQLTQPPTEALTPKPPKKNG